MTWTVGRLHDPKPEELERPFGVLDDAVREAKRLGQRDSNSVFAVWDEHCDVVCIFTCGMRFEPKD